MEKVKSLLLLERPDMSYEPPTSPTIASPSPLSSPEAFLMAPAGVNPPAARPSPVTNVPESVRNPVSSSDPGTILDELTATVAGAYGAILASVDGFSIARSSSVVNQPAHSAMLAAAVGLSHQLVAMGGGRELRQLVVEHDTGFLLIWPVGNKRVLAVLTAASVDQRHLREFVQARANWLSGETS